jgi:hypothetical protein
VQGTRSQFKATGKLGAVLSRTPEPKEGDVGLIGHAYLAAEAPDGLEQIEAAIVFPAERIRSGKLMFTQLDTGMALIRPIREIVSTVQAEGTSKGGVKM